MISGLPELATRPALAEWIERPENRKMKRRIMTRVNRLEHVALISDKHFAMYALDLVWTHSCLTFLREFRAIYHEKLTEQPVISELHGFLRNVAWNMRRRILKRELLQPKNNLPETTVVRPLVQAWKDPAVKAKYREDAKRDALC